MWGLQALPMGGRSTDADFRKTTMTCSGFDYVAIKSTWRAIIKWAAKLREGHCLHFICCNTVSPASVFLHTALCVLAQCLYKGPSPRHNGLQDPIAASTAFQAITTINTECICYLRCLSTFLCFSGPQKDSAHTKSHVCVTRVRNYMLWR